MPFDIIINKNFITDNSLVFDFTSHFLRDSDVQRLKPLIHDGQQLQPLIQEAENCPAMSRAYLKTIHGREVRVPKESILDMSPSDDGGVSDRWESYPNPWEINIEGRKITNSYLQISKGHKNSFKGLRKFV